LRNGYGIKRNSVAVGKRQRFVAVGRQYAGVVRTVKVFFVKNHFSLVAQSNAASAFRGLYVENTSHVAPF
jgi:hypothetical protein